MHEYLAHYTVPRLLDAKHAETEWPGCHRWPLSGLLLPAVQQLDLEDELNGHCETVGERERAAAAACQPIPCAPLQR